MAGKFIVCEGLDGSGKSTLCTALAAEFQGLSRSEPTRESEAGLTLRRLLAEGDANKPGMAETMLTLFREDRLWHVNRVILPALDQGTDVIVDRYYFSTAAYQAQDPAEALRILADYRSSAEFPRPDLVIHLEISPAAALARIRARGDGREMFEKMEQLKRISGNYQAVIAELEKAGDQPLLRLSAGLSREELLSLAAERIRSL